MKVLGDAVLVKVVEQDERKKGCLYIPPSVSTSLKYGEVITVGRGIVSAGKIVPLEMKPGDTVVFGASQLIPIEIEGEEEDLFIVREVHILAILDKPQTKTKPAVQ